MRTPSAYRYGTFAELGQPYGLILPGGYEIPDPTLPPSIPGLPGGEQPLPGGEQPLPGGGTLPLPQPQPEEKKTDWLPWAILGAAMIVGGALVLSK